MGAFRLGVTLPLVVVGVSAWNSGRGALVGEPPPHGSRACSARQWVCLARRYSDTFTDVQVLIDIDRSTEVAAVFRLLGDPTRVRILDALATTDERCVHEIAEAVGASETKVSQALRLLRTAGVVRHRRDGRHMHYRLDDEHVRTLLAVTREHLDCETAAP